MVPFESSFAVNGRTFTPPARPVVVVCLDGSADEYLDAAMSRGLMPHLQKLSLAGWRGMARAAMPTFTNVNNTCIVTGVPPCVHGIGGNFFLNPENGQEVMMNSSTFMRAGTIFPHAQRAGRKVAVVTAKEKLRDIFASGLISEGGIAFSSEKAKAAVKATHGVDEVEKLVGPTPEIYSGDASIYVLKAGVALLKRGLADFLYLSTTDYIQHKFAPDAAGALEFYAAIDAEIGELISLGAVVGVTADHGMNAKQQADGRPNVIFLETELTERFGPGFRVILPITDPYVAHHGALGSFAQVHLPEGMDAGPVQRWLLERRGITEAHDRMTGARLMELPADRMGDIAVASGRDTVLGRTPEWHDLKAVTSGLRSHGGRYEEIVPFLLSEPLNAAYATRAAASEGCFRNSGQRCTAVRRLLVHEKVIEAFTERFVAKAREYVCGDPADDATVVGTVIDEAAARSLEAAVNEAQRAGAKILLGGKRRGALMEPTILSGVPRTAEIATKECFGPLAPIFSIRDLDDAIALSNATAYGLSSGVVTESLASATRAIKGIRAGTVNVNEIPGYRLELSPFGGVKDSGLGIKEGVTEAMKFMTTVKTFSLPW